MKDRVFYDHCPREYQPGLARWRQHHQLRHCIPAPVRSWLLDEASLTQRLVKASQGEFEVRLQGQFWALPMASERQALDLSPRSMTLVRETLLVGRQQPWVYARSIIPATSLVGKNRSLRALGNRSLGSWLFQQPGMSRSPFAVALLAPANSPVPSELQQQQSLWGRRSVFQVNGAPLLVCEIFLPQFRAWPTIGP